MIYELKKLFSSRFFCILIILLLLGNGALAYTQAPNDRGWNVVLEKFFLDYEASPEAYDQQYQIYLETKERAISLQIEAVQKGEDPMVYEFSEPVTISPEAGYTDGELFEALYARKGYPRAYRARLVAMLDSIEENLLVVTDPYMRSYLIQVRDTYDKLVELPVGDGQVGGWEAFFGYRGTGYLLLFAVLAAVTVLGGADRESNIEALLFSAKGGALRILRNKLAAIGVFCAVCSLLMEFCAFAGFAVNTSFHGGTMFLASLEGYSLCPYPIYVYEFEIVRILVRISVLYAFGLLLLLLARLLTNRFAFLLTSAGFVGLQAWWNAGGAEVQGSVTSSLNLFWLLEADGIFRKYTSINLFGRSVPAGVAFGGVLFLSILLSSALLLLFWKRTPGRRGSLPSLSFRWHLPIGLWGFEAKKMFLRAGVLVSLLILIVCKFLLPVPSMTYREKVYFSYMEHLEGELTPEKEKMLAEERAWLLDILAKEAEYNRLYRQGEITYGELSAARMEAHTAGLQFEVLEQVEQEVARIKELNHRGIPAQLVYAKGWESLLGQKWDVFLTLILLLPSFAYALEDRSRFRSVLNSTREGALTVLKIKICFCMAVTAGMSILFFCIEAWKIGGVHTLPLGHSVMASLSAGGTWEISLLGGAVLLLCLRILLCALLSTVAVLLSYRLRHPILCPVLWCGILFLPYLVGCL